MHNQAHFVETKDGHRLYAWPNGDTSVCKDCGQVEDREEEDEVDAPPPSAGEDRTGDDDELRCTPCMPAIRFCCPAEVVGDASEADRAANHDDVPLPEPIGDPGGVPGAMQTNLGLEQRVGIEGPSGLESSPIKFAVEPDARRAIAGVCN